MNRQEKLLLAVLKGDAPPPPKEGKSGPERGPRSYAPPEGKFGLKQSKGLGGWVSYCAVHPKRIVFFKDKLAAIRQVRRFELMFQEPEINRRRNEPGGEELVWELYWKEPKQ